MVNSIFGVEIYYPAFVKLKFRGLLKTFSHETIASWRKKNIAPFSRVYSDGLPAFTALKAKDIKHIVINISKSPQEKDGLFMAINTIMGNLKRYLLGVHHAVRAHRVARYCRHLRGVLTIVIT